MTWLLCDYGEVLSFPQTRAEQAAMATEAGWKGSLDAFTDTYWRLRPEYDRGDFDGLEYWTRLIGESPGPRQLSRLVELDVASWVHPNAASLAGAYRASDRGFQLAIFSNAPTEVAEAVDTAEWAAPFTKRFFSCRLRSVKPEPTAYELVLKGLGASPEEVVFFDDRPANVAAAAAMGIDARQFVEPAQFDEISPRG